MGQHVRTAQQLVDCLRVLVPGISEEELGSVKSEFQSRLGTYGGDTAIGLVPNLAASRIANRFDLHGPAYTVDAACASSLVAVDHAVHELSSGRCDLVIAGGVHLCHDVTLWSIFCQLGALSRSQQMRPFDRRADGLLLGEGIGILVLKRGADAQRDGDRVYAVIRGTGVTSDGREASLMQPRADGQLMALSRAWKSAALEPSTIGLLEAHGTAMPVGDTTELTSLARFFGIEGDAVIGSVKSMIGHTMPAAGAAGLIKVALAVYHGVLPPTLHCEEPHPRLSETIFRPLSKAEPWEGELRCAGVNAFGFGGINAHVILDAPADAGAPQYRGVREALAHRLHLVSADRPEALLASLESGYTGSGRCRLAVLDPTPERLEKARRIIEHGKPWQTGRHGIWYAPEGLAHERGKIAFLFPGVEPSFEPRVDDVAACFGLSVPQTHGDDLEGVGRGIVEMSCFLCCVLGELGVSADLMAGHSIGEWSGMIASGLIPEEAVDPFIDSLVSGSLEVPGVVFAATGCRAERAEEALSGLEELAISHDNCPHQVVLCGREDSVDTAMARLLDSGVLCQKLPFRHGFHSPFFLDYVEPHRGHLARLPLGRAKVPLWSATTCEPYPDDPDAVRTLAIEHLVKPVRFRELVERLHDEGARIFIQVGVGSLVGFVGDTLRGRPHIAVSANVPKKTGLEQLTALAAALWVEGVPVRFDRLPLTHNLGAGREVTLSLAAPVGSVTTPLSIRFGGLQRMDVADDASPVLAEFSRTMREIQAAHPEVVAAFQDAQSRPARLDPRELTQRRTLSVDTFPALIDHCFYRQPEDWPEMSDRFPVVPMTTAIAMMMDVARELVPELTPIAVERVRAYRWIAVAPPVEIEMTARFDGGDRVEVAIEGYVSATVRLAKDVPAAPGPRPFVLELQTPAPHSAEQLYADRWMFHGPRFQGVQELGPMGDNGIQGVLESLPTPGALLDNAGQLLGYWVTVKTEVNRLAMPVKVDRLSFYGPQPPPNARLECRVRVLALEETLVRADIDLLWGGQLWAVIEGWEDQRFDTDELFSEVMRYPGLNAFGVMREDGYCFVRETWRSTASRALIARQFLGRTERSTYEGVSLSKQRLWLLGRIAVKDAVRHWLWERGHGPVFPVEIVVENARSGRPLVRGPFSEDLRVSIAHKEDVAVAIVADGRDVGIDIERIEPRGADFEKISFTDAERATLPKANRDEWVTRFWVVKEAVAKVRGRSMLGNLRRFAVTDIASNRLLVDGLWVETRNEGEHIVGWTES